jgi:hypothetical protein
LDALLRLNLNAFSIIVAVILLFGSRSRSDRAFADYHLFTWMLEFTILELVVDSVSWLAAGRQGELWRITVVASNVIYYIGHPIVPMLYSVYVVYQAKDGLRRARRWIPYLAIPAAISGLLSATSPLTGLFFSVDMANVYRHGPLFAVFAALTETYAAFTLVFIIAKRRSFEPRTIVALLLFPLPPACAGLVQMMNYGLVITWPASKNGSARCSNHSAFIFG